MCGEVSSSNATALSPRSKNVPAARPIALRKIPNVGVVAGVGSSARTSRTKTIALIKKKRKKADSEEGCIHSEQRERKCRLIDQ